VLRINSEQLITTSADNGVRLWTLSNGTFACGYFNHTQSVKSVVVLGGRLVTGGCDSTLKVWDTTNGGTLLSTFTNAHTGCVNDLKLNPLIPTHGALVSVGADKLVKTWYFNVDYTLVLFGEAMGPFEQAIYCFVILSTGHMVFGSNRIDMRDINRHNIINSPGFVYPTGVSTPTAILSMAVLSDGVTVACGMNDGKILLFNTNSKTFDSILIGHTSAVNALVLIQLPSTNKTYLMSGSDDKRVNFWDDDTTKELVKQINLDVSVKSLAYLANDNGTISSKFLKFYFKAS
jgi:WD40 repeat protein